MNFISRLKILKKMMSEKENEEKTWKDIVFSENLSGILSIISILVLVAIIIIFFVCGNWSFSYIIDEEKVGQFGDFVGGVVGTILAFVASILYYVALKAQKKDIKINQSLMELQTKTLQLQIKEFEKQKEELGLSREVYIKQSKIMEQQESVMRIQQFESNFYSLLNVYITIKSELNKNSKNSDFFKDKYDQLSLFVDSLINKNDHPLDCHNKMTHSYMNLIHLNKGNLTHYFRIIYRLIKMVDSNIFLKDIDKNSYIKIIRSQLTDYEQLIMHYNSHSSYGIKSHKLIYKYNLLKHINVFDKLEFNLRNKNLYISSTIFVGFISWLSEFLEYSVNAICDQDIEDYEMKWNKLNCVVNLSDKDDFTLKVTFFDKKLIPIDFDKIIYHYLNDKLFISQYRYERDGIMNYTENDIDTQSKCITYHLDTRITRKLNIDKNYEYVSE